MEADAVIGIFLGMYVVPALAIGTAAACAEELPRVVHAVAITVLWPIAVPIIATIGAIDLIAYWRHEHKLEAERRRAAIETEFKKALEELADD